MENSQLNFLKRLLTNIVPNIDKTKTDKYISYFERILNSRLHCITTNEAHIISLMLEKANTQSRDHSSLTRIQSLYTNLGTKKILKNRWAILYLLYRISQDNNENQIKEPSNLLQLIYKDNNIVNNGLPSFSNDSDKKIKDICVKNNPIGLNLVVSGLKANKVITEKDLIDDLIFVFQGIDGHYINYNSITNSFTLNSTIPFNSNVYDIVNILSELGWLYMKVNSYLNLFKEINSNSQFLQAFSHSIQNELNEYYKLISVFKNMNSHFNVKDMSGNNSETTNHLSLKKLLFWTLEPLERMKWVAIACESVYSKI
jgi:gamma-tubulin complex component 3